MCPKWGPIASSIRTSLHAATPTVLAKFKCVLGKPMSIATNGSGIAALLRSIRSFLSSNVTTTSVVPIKAFVGSDNLSDDAEMVVIFVIVFSALAVFGVIVVVDITLQKAYAFWTHYRSYIFEPKAKIDALRRREKAVGLWESAVAHQARTIQLEIEIGVEQRVAQIMNRYATLAQERANGLEDLAAEMIESDSDDEALWEQGLIRPAVSGV
ncbi:uncharacterized protein C8R40DRAFT_1067622 [Lentinula edodes]|uniref:uncharacterized protein n=1 Tax=Lentinula edodes TaxID=5353 RepID=UPI001E8D9C94|nr:uncharacterized protein C8R40DRAFT_1067622 [Lentinula edodes]KAH7878062.1 hypothetical protein C8R40DRAFT_1067622 [Lentinula edodes]